MTEAATQERHGAITKVDSGSLLPAPSKVSPREYQMLIHQARAAVASGLLPSGVNTWQKALIILNKGAELGIKPMAAMTSIYVIDGKPSLSAGLLQALVYRDFGPESLWVAESSADRCVVEFTRGRRTGRVVWTSDDARRAGLLADKEGKGGKPNWNKYPADMLWARAMASAVRKGFPEVAFGIYTAEELGASVMLTSDGDVVLDVTEEGEIITEGQTTQLGDILSQAADSTPAFPDDEPEDAEFRVPDPGGPGPEPMFDGTPTDLDADSGAEEFSYATVEQLGTIEELHTQLGRTFEPYDMTTEEARNLILRLTAEVNAQKPATNGSSSKPASANQLATVAKLSRLLGRPEEPSEDMTSAEASARITDLSNEYNERKSDAAARRR